MKKTLFWGLLLYVVHFPLMLSAQFHNSPLGFAHNTTGGSNGKVYTVTSLKDAGPGSLREAIQKPEPLIIEFAVSGTVHLKSLINFKSNKTIDAANQKITITGYGFNLYSDKNIIIRNLSFENGLGEDAISISESSNIWIDHCTFTGYKDGLVDIKRRSNNITISWCYFHDHEKVILVGHSDNFTEDNGYLNVTLHHNYFLRNDRRHPRLRFGKAHVVNNYFKEIGVFACSSPNSGELFMEANYLEDVNEPSRVQHKKLEQYIGYLQIKDNYNVNVSKPYITNGKVFDPIDYYKYTPETANEKLKSRIKTYAGANKTGQLQISDEDNKLIAPLAINYQWYLNDEIIDGANQQFYNPSTSGLYSVKLIGDNNSSIVLKKK